MFCCRLMGRISSVKLSTIAFLAAAMAISGCGGGPEYSAVADFVTKNTTVEGTYGRNLWVKQSKAHENVAPNGGAGSIYFDIGGNKATGTVRAEYTGAGDSVEVVAIYHVFPGGAETKTWPSPVAESPAPITAPTTEDETPTAPPPVSEFLQPPVEGAPATPPVTAPAPVAP